LCGCSKGSPTVSLPRRSLDRWGPLLLPIRSLEETKHCVVTAKAVGWFHFSGDLWRGCISFYDQLFIVPEENKDILSCLSTRYPWQAPWMSYSNERDTNRVSFSRRDQLFNVQEGNSDILYCLSMGTLKSCIIFPNTMGFESDPIALVQPSPTLFDSRRLLSSWSFKNLLFIEDC